MPFLVLKIKKRIYAGLACYFDQYKKLITPVPPISFNKHLGGCKSVQKVKTYASLERD